MTQQVLNRDDPREIPELTRSKDDPGQGHTAVVYFAHGEPETYDPIGWINQFNEFDEQEIPFVPFLARPYFIHALRKKYLEVGKSNHRQTHIEMLRNLEKAYRDAGDHSTRFYVSFLDDDPRPDAAVIEALNGGASRIIVSEVFLTISNHTAEGKDLIEELDVEDYGVPIVYTGPMWDSPTLKSMFVQRANANLDGSDKSNVGVLLVGHGQPDEWDVEWPTETEHEIEFREEVLKLLEAEGYLPQNLSMAWMEFKEPKPAAKIEQFVKQGVERVLYFSAAISADALHSQADVPELVEKAKVPHDFPMVNLGAWNNDPIVIQAIKEKIDPLLAAS
jgi:sirohydrochlorin ferrochelatase